MARCPRCLNPMDDERKCVDARCGDRVVGSSSRMLWTIFALVGMAHLALMVRIGVPVVERPVPIAFWLFVALCWLFVNSAVTIAIYAAYVFAFEAQAGEFRLWAKRGVEILRAIAWGRELPARQSSQKKA